MAQKELQRFTEEKKVSVCRTTLNHTLYKMGLNKRVARKMLLLEEKLKKTC